MQFKRTKINYIRGLTPEKLARMIECFMAGDIREFALTMEAIQNRDDLLKSVIPKRSAAVTRLAPEVVVLPNIEEDQRAEAEQHRKALQYFWNNITVTDAFDKNQKRGFSLLVQQMMDAQAKKYAVHELLWRPSPDGLTCQFNFAPLWLFENRTGALRYLPTDFDIFGQELEDGQWMISCGQHLMEACSVAYLFKHLSLNAWLEYCERCGIPGVQGKTKAPLDSEGWKAMEEIVKAVGQNMSCVTGEEEEVTPLDFGLTGNLPMPGLTERMDRAMAALWRGADLQTMSAGSGDGAGASLQGKESDMLTADDAQWATETLNSCIDPLVIAWTFGEGVKPLAGIKIAQPPKADVKSDIAVSEHLVKMGAPVSVDDELERFNRSRPPEGADLLTAPVPASPFGGGAQDPGADPALDTGATSRRGDFFGNESRQDRMLLVHAQQRLARAQSEALRPLTERVQGILQIANEAAFWGAMRRLRDDLPQILRNINRDPKTARAIEDSEVAALFNGLAEGKVTTHMANELVETRRAALPAQAAPQTINIDVHVPENKPRRLKFERDEKGSVVAVEAVATEGT